MSSSATANGSWAIAYREWWTVLDPDEEFPNSVGTMLPLRSFSSTELRGILLEEYVKRDLFPHMVVADYDAGLSTMRSLDHEWAYWSVVDLRAGREASFCFSKASDAVMFKLSLP